MAAAERWLFRSIVGLSLASIAAGCAPAVGDRLGDVRYAGDIQPAQPRPVFAAAPPTRPAASAAVSDARVGGPAGRSATDNQAVVARSAPAALVGAVDWSSASRPITPPPLRRPETAAARTDSEPRAPDVAATPRPDAPAGLAPSAAAPRRLLSLGDGAAGLSAADWAELAELARRQRESGGTVRVEIYPTGRTTGGALDSADRLLERAEAMATALARLGVDTARIAVMTVDRPAGTDGVPATAAAWAPRVFLDSDGAAG